MFSNTSIDRLVRAATPDRSRKNLCHLANEPRLTALHEAEAHLHPALSQSRGSVCNTLFSLDDGIFDKIAVSRGSSSVTNFAIVRPTMVVCSAGTCSSKSSRPMINSNESAGCNFWLRMAVCSMAMITGWSCFSGSVNWS